MKERQLVDKDHVFINAPEDQLFRLWMAYYPGGAGPLAAMKTICSLIENIAHLRGIDTSKWPARSIGN